MGSVKNKNIKVTNLNIVKVPGGDVLHILKNYEKNYRGFGEAYFSWIKKKSIKAWKRHKNMTMNLVVPIGRVKFVFFKSDLKYHSQEIIGDKYYYRLTVPPGFWFGFQGLTKTNSLLLNIANIPHDPKEVEKKPLNFINFKWSKE